MSEGKVIRKYLDILKQQIEARLVQHFSPETILTGIPDWKSADSAGRSVLSRFFRSNKLSNDEIMITLIALAPHFDPAFFDNIILEKLSGQGDFPQFGGVRGKNHRGFLPTMETALFVLAGSDLDRRMKVEKIFSTDHFLVRNNVILLTDIHPGEPEPSGRLVIAPEYLSLFFTGRIAYPRFSMDFPAELITTELTDKDLVLPEITNRQVAELENWVNYQDKVLNKWDLHRWVKPGYRALFHGPSGTGKTLTAMIVGKKCNRDVFRIDLSMVISKYIGETEKNLSQLFDRAKNKDWILFFDEADALFGKRTNVRDAHDKYANQEVAYLLQKIENHNGLVILASNFKSNIDDAFVRRFQSIIYFPPPVPAERFSLWKKVLPANNGMEIPADEDLMILSKKYEITGAGIVNVVHHSCLEAAASGKKNITLKDLQAGIEREYLKEGKVI
jgi:hypothetical protein